MNWRRIARPAGAGLTSLIVFVGGVALALHLAFTQFGLAPFESEPSLHPVLAYSGILIISALAALGLTLPALSLGARWARALGAAALAGVVFLFFLLVLIFPIPLKLGLAFLAVVVTPVLISAIAISGDGDASRRPIRALAVSAVALYVVAVLPVIVFPSPSTAVVGWIVAATSWLISPALASALRPA